MDYSYRKAASSSSLFFEYQYSSNIKYRFVLSFCNLGYVGSPAKGITLLVFGEKVILKELKWMKKVSRLECPLILPSGVSAGHSSYYGIVY